MSHKGKAGLSNGVSLGVQITGYGEMDLWLKALTALPEDQGSAPTWQIITIWDSSFR
ncbi:rCG20347 [Rattus norvegicus]|uniref:RCG20347 n=1 Tax=Rattus norvegicus TaxID=10116 RepID=A6JG63_RAT|nr:rCG20347 [Rattus norvegicus]